MKKNWYFLVAVLVFSDSFLQALPPLPSSLYWSPKLGRFVDATMNLNRMISKIDAIKYLKNRYEANGESITTAQAEQMLQDMRTSSERDAQVAGLIDQWHANRATDVSKAGGKSGDGTLRYIAWDPLVNKYVTKLGDLDVMDPEKAKMYVQAYAELGGNPISEKEAAQILEDVRSEAESGEKFAREKQEEVEQFNEALQNELLKQSSSDTESLLAAEKIASENIGPKQDIPIMDDSNTHEESDNGGSSEYERNADTKFGNGHFSQKSNAYSDASSAKELGLLGATVGIAGTGLALDHNREQVIHPDDMLSQGWNDRLHAELADEKLHQKNSQDVVVPNNSAISYNYPDLRTRVTQEDIDQARNILGSDKREVFSAPLVSVEPDSEDFSSREALEQAYTSLKSPDSVPSGQDDISFSPALKGVELDPKAIATLTAFEQALAPEILPSSLQEPEALPSSIQESEVLPSNLQEPEALPSNWWSQIYQILVAGPQAIADVIMAHQGEALVSALIVAAAYLGYTYQEKLKKALEIVKKRLFKEEAMIDNQSELVDKLLHFER